MPKIAGKSGEQVDAEAEVEGFKQDLGPFVVAAETTRMPMVFLDAKEAGYPIIFANDAFLNLTGYRREEVLAQGFRFIVSQKTDDLTLAKIDAEFEIGNGNDDSLEAFCGRKDGSEFWALIYISPVRDESGEVVQHFASFVDISEHKNQEYEAKILIDELNHRVKNTLSTVQAIVYQALRTATDPEVIRESIESRLFALSRSHDLLSRETWRSAALVDVIKEALLPFGVTDGRAERFMISGQNHRFPPKAVLALSIAINELATNAVKYGAFSNEAGTIAIWWTVEPSSEGDLLILHWQEKDGPRVSPPTRKGFGSRVLERGLAYELGGTVTLNYFPDGLHCTINIPAATRTQ